VTGALAQAVPTGLLDAFWAYETAVLSNDQTTLNALFAPGKDTVRGDGKVLLVGHEAIAGFRSARTSRPAGGVLLHVRVLAPRPRCARRAPGNRQLACRRRSGSGARRLEGDRHAHRGLGPLRAATRVGVLGDPLGAADGPVRGLRVAVKGLFAVAGHLRVEHEAHSGVSASWPLCPQFLPAFPLS
jgi:hypothetical protein